jgi:uncharacterized protein
MKIIISDIPKEGLNVQIDEAVEFEKRSAPVKAQLRIEKLGTEIIVSGSLHTEVPLQCSRCLKDFSHIISVPVDVVYHPLDELKGEDHYEVKNEELDTDFYAGEEMELNSLLQEQIDLNIPMKPLCSDFCKGICPVCGTDLNTDNCTCQDRKTDPRFEGLKKLFHT